MNTWEFINNYKHLKKKKVLLQFSDGSSIFIFCFVKKKELLTEVDIRSSVFWKNDTLNEVAFNRDSRRSLKIFDKLFIIMK